MKLILILLLIFPSLLYSQRSIKGVVVSASNEPISNANVFIQNKDSVIKKFTKTSSEGRFDLKNFDLQNGDLLRVSHINYRPFSQKIDLLVDTFISIKLIKDSVFLNEVIVNTKIPPIRNIGDTTKYSLPSFINGSEIRLEDILKKLPGIVVDNNGKLSFNGKQIDKVLIEGQNFFSKDYTLITKTLSAELIGSIEAIENFNEENFFSDIKKGEETILNVGIKKNVKLKLFGEFGGSVGTNKDWQLANSLFSLSGKKQIGLINNYNDYGDDIKPNVSEQMLIKEKLKNPQNLSFNNREIPITNFTPLSTNISSNRNLFANVGVSSIQFNTNLFKSLNLKSSLTFKKNNLLKRDLNSTTLINTGSILFVDSGQLSTDYNTIISENNLEYLINNKNKIKIEANISRSDFLSDNIINTKFSSQNFNSYYGSTNENNPYNFKGTFLRKIDSTSLLEIVYFKMKNRNDFSIRSLTNRYNSFLGINPNATEIIQFANIIDQHNGININFYKKTLNHRFNVSSSFIKSSSDAESFFQYKLNSNTLNLTNPGFTNNINLATEIFSLSIKDDWNKKNFFSSIQLTLQSEKVNILNKNTGLLNSLPSKAILPYFLFGYKINSLNKIGFIYSAYNQVNDILAYTSGYIQQNNNDFNRGNVQSGSVKTNEFGISHTYNDFFNNGWKVVTGFNYSKKERPVFNSSQFINTSIVQTKETAILSQQAIGINLSIDKYLSFLKSTLSLNTIAQNVINFDNVSVPDFKQNDINYFTIKSSLKSGFSKWINFYTSAEFLSSKVNIIQKTNQLFSSNRINNVILSNTIFFKISDKFYGDLNYEFANFKFAGSSTNTNYCNFRFSYKPSKSALSFQLFGRNIFNNTTQITNNIIAPFIINNSSQLLPRTLILSANWKL